MIVLVVEDDPSMRELYQMALNRIKAKVFITEYLEAAVAALPVDVAVIDYSLPTTTGVQVFYELRKDQADLPVIFATAAMSQRELDEICNTGGVLLRKPFTLSELHEAIRKAVET